MNPRWYPEAQAAPVLGPLEGDSGSPYESRTHRQTVAGVAVQLAVAALGVSAQVAQRLGVPQCVSAGVSSPRGRDAHVQPESRRRRVVADCQRQAPFLELRGFVDNDPPHPKIDGKTASGNPDSDAAAHVDAESGFRVSAVVAQGESPRWESAPFLRGSCLASFRGRPSCAITVASVAAMRPAACSTPSVEVLTHRASVLIASPNPSPPFPMSSPRAPAAAMHRQPGLQRQAAGRCQPQGAGSVTCCRPERHALGRLVPQPRIEPGHAGCDLAAGPSWSNAPSP